MVQETPHYKYVYQFKDHLSNIRMNYAVDPADDVLKDENHYYPFGLKHSNYNSEEYAFREFNAGIRLLGKPPVEDPNFFPKDGYDYKYNGKEWQDELNLNLYDYGARNYDPAIGRWMNIDPNSYKYVNFTPYNYTFNNPVLINDPDGKDGIVTGSGIKTNPFKVRANYYYYYYYYGLDENQAKGFLSALKSYNNDGEAHQIEAEDGTSIFVIFELSATEVSNGSIAKEMAQKDEISIENDGNVAVLNFGNTVTNGIAGDTNHLGNANSNHINLDSNATMNFYNSAKPNVKISDIYKGTAIHEIGHNLGGNHNDPGNIMKNSKSEYNSGGGINQTKQTVFSLPSVNTNGIQAIMGRVVKAGEVGDNYKAGYGQVQTRYFGNKQNAKITEGTVGRLVQID